jgi:hypothetical protein
MWSTRGFVIIGMLIGLIGGVAFGINEASAQDDSATYRWDIFQFVSSDPFTAGEGGVAYAYAQDNTIIMLTGSGTFQPGDPTAVTGGGTWTTFPEHGMRPTGEGTYTVTELISFVEAPGTIPAAIVDTIGERTDARAGLAVMRIEYADAAGNPDGTGVLTVSSRLPVDSPASVFVGITVTKDYVAFWDRFEPVRGVNANRANFHVIPETSG